DEMVAPVEGARLSTKGAAGEAVDVRDDHVKRASRSKHAGRFAQERQGLHNVLERREQRHRVERAVFETRLLERDVEHLEPVHLSRMRERPRRELEADSVPAPLARERKEEPERAADVEDAPAVRLERIEHPGELAPVELLLPRRRDDAEPAG